MKFNNQAALCRRIRKKYGYTQNDLAKIMFLGSSGAQQISNIEGARCGFPLHRIKYLFPLIGKDIFIKALFGDLVDQINESSK